MAGSFGYSYIHRTTGQPVRKPGTCAMPLPDQRRVPAIFDADFAPRHDFLAETLPYMDDPKIAIVQTPSTSGAVRRRPGLKEPRADTGSVLPDGAGGPQPAGRGCVLRTSAVYRRSALEPDGRPSSLRRGRAHRARCAPRRLVHNVPADPALDGHLPRQSRRVRTAAIPVVLGNVVSSSPGVSGRFPCAYRRGWLISLASFTMRTPRCSHFSAGDPDHHAGLSAQSGEVAELYRPAARDAHRFRALSAVAPVRFGRNLAARDCPRLGHVFAIWDGAWENQ